MTLVRGQTECPLNIWLQRWISSLKFVQSGDAWSDGILMSLLGYNFPRVKWLSPTFRGSQWKMENQSNISCEGHPPPDREHLPLHDSSVKAENLDFLSGGGGIFLFRTVTEYWLFAALCSSYLWVYPGLFITILKFNSPIMTPLPLSVLLQSSYLVLLSHWLPGERIRELANCIY